jgi:hypothetical protein
VFLKDVPTVAVQIDDSLTVLLCVETEDLAGIILHDAKSLLPMGNRLPQRVPLAQLLENLVAKSPDKLWHLCSRSLSAVRHQTVALR